MQTEIRNNEIPVRRSDPYKPKRSRVARIRVAVRSKLSRYPQIEAAAVSIWRHGSFLFWTTKWTLEALIGSRRGAHARGIDIDKVYWVSPQKISFSALSEFNVRDFKGRILAGDWDLLEKRFDSLDLYTAIKQVCVEGKTWSDTLYYQRALDDLKKTQPGWGDKAETDLNKRCKRIEYLYDAISHNGFKSQKELFLEGQILDPITADEEISVCIGRFGDLLFSDGAHRLAIAKLLAVPAVPVKVTVRHADWIRLRDELQSYARDGNTTKEPKLYQPVTHPDLADLPASHRCEDRFQMIKNSTSIKQGRVLDIGANLGYFCHRFAEAGFECYAVENDPPTARFLAKLARAENRDFKIIRESVFESQEVKNTRFDIVLALNIFHHFLKTREAYDKLVDLLMNLHVGELFFESHRSGESQMQGAFRDYSAEEFVKFIMDNSGLKSADLISVTSDGRSLYKLY